MPTASRRRFRIRASRRNGATEGTAIHGTARLGRKTKDLVKRLGPGDIAVIDHTNVDRIAAEELIATGVRAVINTSDSSNGRYPNSGPLLLTEAGGYVARWDGTPYSFHDGGLGILAATSRKLWDEAAEVLFAGGALLAGGHELLPPSGQG